MTQDQLLRAAQRELSLHTFSAFNYPAPGSPTGVIVVPGCPHCKLRLESIEQFMRHLSEDVLPQIIAPRAIPEWPEGESYPLPLPKDGDAVFSIATHPYRHLFEEFYGTENAYVWGYINAAKRLYLHAEEFKGQFPDHPMDASNYLVYPIYFLYRHAIELSLKQIRTRFLAPTTTKPHLVPMMSVHDLCELWSEVKNHVRNLADDDLQQAIPAFEKLLEEIQQADPKGDAGRYDIHRNRTETLKGLRPLDLNNLNASLTKMVNFLNWVQSLQQKLPRQKPIV